LIIKCPKCNADNPDTQKFCGECGTLLDSAKDTFVTKTLKTPKPYKTIAGKYKLQEKLGEGGMGIIYKAKDIRLDRTVALKFLPPELTRDLEAKERFIQEAKAAAALDHPNICTVYEVDEADNQTFIAMAYIKGQSLKDKLESGPLDIDEAKDIAIQIAEGLKDAHEKGIIHRDIKPANIMLTEKGQAKITDFGLAKLSWGVDLTKTSTIMGTVAYMSPEQAKGQDVDQRTDIWSFGAMLYEMLTGARPFKRTHDQATLYAVLNESPEPIEKLRKGIPPGLALVVLKCLEKFPDNRYRKMEAVISALESVATKFRSIPSTVKASKEATASIVVLPFVNMSADPEQDYFCDGLAEEIINALTKIKDLKVVARTSAFAFKGEKLDVREIGGRLNVGTVLEGSVRKSGNRLRITAQLINVADGCHLWSDKFDRNLEDVFTIQDEISEAIVDNLKVRLLKGERDAVFKRYTENIEAYSLYLKGIYFLRMYTVDGFKKAIEFFQAALQKDPDYALAYAGLAEVFYPAAFWGNVPPREAYPKTKKYALKALEKDDTVSDAYAALGLVYTFYEWDRQEAEKTLKRALELNPNSSIAHMSYSWYLTLTRHHEEAVIEAKTAQALDPLSALINAHVGFALFWARKFDEAVEELEASLSITPNFHLSHYYLSLCLKAKSRMEDAIQENEKAVQFSGGAPLPTMNLAATYFETGKKEQGENLLITLKERSKHEYLPPIGFYLIHLFRDELDQAFEWFERAFDQRDSFFMWCLDFPIKRYDVPDEPRFNALLEKIGLGK
jgi:serine/threonine protein kinase/tetratricopeptide (TPR) repeat protein